MSGALYAGLAALAVVVIAGFAMWLAIRSARKEGGATAQAVASKEVADNARTAAAVRADVARTGDAAARERLSKWTRD